VLRKTATEIDLNDETLKTFIADLFETMYHAEGVGLAAPQVGKSVRVVVIDLDALSDDMPEYKDFRRVFINGHIVEYDESQTDTSEEGCLSLPAIHEKVTRPKRIRVQWLDEQMQPHDEWIEGYLARVIQHEFDHLEGKVFTDRISPLRKQLIKSKLKALLQGRFRCGYRTKVAKR
jgi:peptide deformylase